MLEDLGYKWGDDLKEDFLLAIELMQAQGPGTLNLTVLSLLRTCIQGL